MSLFNVFTISGTGMSAQSVRLNATASNIANADSVSSSLDQTYRARHPVFAAQMQKAAAGQDSTGVGVKVLGIVESNKPLTVEHAPEHPMADKDGYIYKPNVTKYDYKKLNVTRWIMHIPPPLPPLPQTLRTEARLLRSSIDT